MYSPSRPSASRQSGAPDRVRVEACYYDGYCEEHHRFDDVADCHVQQAGDDNQLADLKVV
jgi:hypothetical protein